MVNNQYTIKKTILGEKFSEIAFKNYSNIAIKYNSELSMTYEDLDKFSENIAKKLIGYNIKAGNVILISGDKNPTMFALIIASIKLGVTYSIFDPEIPQQRLINLINICKPNLLITSNEKYIKYFKGVNKHAVKFSDFNTKIKNKIKWESNSDYEDNLAYIVFTSGSTGVPKGISISHKNLIELINWANKYFEITCDEIFTNLNPCYFDNFVFDFYASIFNGATLFPVHKELLTDPKALLDNIELSECTSWFSVPTLLIYLNTLKAFEGRKLKSLKRIIFGGEGYPKAKLYNFYKSYKKKINFFNVYGPSECTCIATCYKVTDADFSDFNGFLPIGDVIENFNYIIFDEKNEIVTDSKKGELILYGPAVGQGYVGNLNLTKKNFINVNFLNAKFENGIAYKTGDIVSLNKSDNKLYIYGRIDNQIKHMGFRIELEDIENSLMKISYIQHACCIQKIKNDISKIYAYIVSKKRSNIVEIKVELSKHIPTYMFPTNFIFLNKLPINRNGKVDRNALQQTDEYEQ